MKLCEVMVQAGQQLSVMQQTCLLKVYLAQSVSADAAVQTMKGNDQLFAAGEFLLNQALIQSYDGGVVVTPKGKNELALNGLIDQSGVTDKGRQMVDQSSSGGVSS